MSSARIISTIDELLHHVERCLRNEQWLEATGHLAAIYNCITNIFEPSDERDAIVLRITQIDLPHTAIQEVTERFRERYENMLRMTSKGRRFQYEELVLIIGHHRWLMLVKEYMDFRGISWPDCDLEKLESQIRKIGARWRNRYDYKAALESLRRPKDLPTKTAWE